MRKLVKNDPKRVELMNFLIERTKDVKSPLNLCHLAKEYKETIGSSQLAHSLRMRLQKVSLVEVDKENRIIKYKAKDGSLELAGHHNKSIKIKTTKDRKQQIMDESRNDSDDGSQDSTPKTPGSVKRTATQVSNSSKRTKTNVEESDDHASDGSAGIPSREPPLLTQPKLETIPKDSRAENSREAPIFRNRGAPGAPGAPRASRAARAHIPQGASERPKSDAAFLSGTSGAPGARTRQEAPSFRVGCAPEATGAHFPRVTPIKTESGADDAYTPQIKFLEVIQSLVLNLDMPSLIPLQAKIEKKIRESSSNEKIANDEMVPAMEFLVAKLTNHSVSNLSENVESVGLSHFLCYLKSAILNSKLEGLENLLEKIKERIKDPSSKDKNIPADKIVKVLLHTLDGIGY